MGTTFAIFRLSGKQQVCNDLLKMSHNGRCILSITALITLGDISLIDDTFYFKLISWIKKYSITNIIL